MEQYWTSKELISETLRACLDNYKLLKFHIRDCRSHGLKVNINFDHEQKFDFKYTNSDISFIVDSEEVIKLTTDDASGFSLAYHREDAEGQWILLQKGIDPYDPKLPEPKTSMLRNIFDYHEVEIIFEGRIDLKFHSWWKEPHWKYWTIKV